MTAQPLESIASAVYKPENWTENLRISDLFTIPAPLEVEIGCGKGRFLSARAATHPEINFLGIDRMLRRIRKSDKKIIRFQLKNVRLLRIEAAYALERLLPPLCVSTYYVFFPDPWPKRRHHQRRLFSPAFMDMLDRTLIPGGTLYFATDHTDYSDWVRKLFAKDPRFTAVPHLEPREEERTEFEILFTGQGLTISRSGFKKIAPTTK